MDTLIKFMGYSEFILVIECSALDRFLEIDKEIDAVPENLRLDTDDLRANHIRKLLSKGLDHCNESGVSVIGES